MNNVNTSIGPSSVGEKEHVLHGVGFITEHLRGLVFEISANSFFQTNTDQVFIERGQVLFIILWECGVSSIPIYIVIHNFLNTSHITVRQERFWVSKIYPFVDFGQLALMDLFFC